MLSHQDVHYLTGLLQVVTSPRPVEVELGSMVLDDAAETERDVDITVKYKLDNESTSVLVGLEVKDHARPLDVTHVEQLGAKMHDMGAITDRAIVSASGFYEPAIRKALKHGIRLLELEEWDPRDDVFPAVMTHWKTFRERAVAWDELRVTFEVSDSELQAALESNAALTDEAGKPLEKPNDVSSLVDEIARQVSSHYSKMPKFEALPVGEHGRIEVKVELEERPCVKLSTGPRALTSAELQGNLFWVEHHHPVHFRRLIDITDSRRPIVGCGLAEMSTGELMGITTNIQNGSSLIRIATSDRKQAVIRRRRLR